MLGGHLGLAIHAKAPSCHRPAAAVGLPTLAQSALPARDQGPGHPRPATAGGSDRQAASASLPSSTIRCSSAPCGTLASVFAQFSATRSSARSRINRTRPMSTFSRPSSGAAEPRFLLTPKHFGQHEPPPSDQERSRSGPATRTSSPSVPLAGLANVHRHLGCHHARALLNSLAAAGSEESPMWVRRPVTSEERTETDVNLAGTSRQNGALVRSRALRMALLCALVRSEWRSRALFLAVGRKQKSKKGERYKRVEERGRSPGPR